MFFRTFIAYVLIGKHCHARKLGAYRGAWVFDSERDAPMPLSDTTVRMAKPRSTTYRLSDSQGLYVEVAPSGSRYWRLKYRFAGKEKRLALGVYPTVALAKARDDAREARRLLSDGIDPSIWPCFHSSSLRTSTSTAFCFATFSLTTSSESSVNSIVIRPEPVASNATTARHPLK